jgi:hypothetical protein
MHGAIQGRVGVGLASRITKLNSRCRRRGDPLRAATVVPEMAGPGHIGGDVNRASVHLSTIRKRSRVIASTCFGGACNNGRMLANLRP